MMFHGPQDVIEAPFWLFRAVGLPVTTEMVLKPARQNNKHEKRTAYNSEGAKNQT
jgi:hypothetical protein